MLYRERCSLILAKSSSNSSTNCRREFDGVLDFFVQGMHFWLDPTVVYV